MHRLGSTSKDGELGSLAGGMDGEGDSKKQLYQMDVRTLLCRQRIASDWKRVLEHLLHILPSPVSHTATAMGTQHWCLAMRLLSRFSFYLQINISFPVKMQQNLKILLRGMCRLHFNPFAAGAIFFVNSFWAQILKT